MVSASTWKSLRIDKNGLPTLLVKAELQPSGYKILLTDLAHIWIEQLTRLDIIERARSCGCSIDPSQGDDQQEILMSHIGKALSNEDGTTLELCPVPENPESLLLHLNAPLPVALPPLEWTVVLHLSSAHIIADELVMPLLHKTDDLRRQVQYLITEIHIKDRIISKISDRLEVSGNDLTTVFPNVSRVKTSRKKPQREQLGPHIQGLSEFDEVSWRAHTAETTNVSNLAVDTIDEIVAELPERAFTITNGRANDRWWQHLAKQSPDISQNKMIDLDPLIVQQADQGSMQMDGFQRQPTPQQLIKQPKDDKQRPSPRVSNSGVNPDPATLEDESTEDDDADDLDAAPPSGKPGKDLKQTASTAKSQPKTPMQSSPPDSQPTDPTRSKNGSNGALIRSSNLSPESVGASEVSTPQAVPEDKDTIIATTQAPSRSNTKLGVIGGKRLESEPEHVTTVKQLRPKLGMFGGKIESSASTSNPSRNHVKSEAENPPLPQSAKRSEPLVVDSAIIAPDKGQSQSMEVEESSRVSPPPYAQDHATGPDETEEERANKKRTQLRMELEQKSKGHAKKKRKF
nr:hypothetical protein CFP56_66824 [Quercus suber]